MNKGFLLVLLLLSSFTAIQAQEDTTTALTNTTQFGGNGGQYHEDSYARLGWVGHANNLYTISITNKQDCKVEFKVKWLGNDTVVVVSKYATINVQLPGPPKNNERIRIKPTKKCNPRGKGNLGWLEICTPHNLPLRFVKFSVNKVNKFH